MTIEAKDTLAASTREEAKRIAREHGANPAMALASIRPFRISSMSELLLMRQAVIRSTGLSVGQFAENPWGFPFIPYPVEAPNHMDGGVYRLSPKSLNPEFVPHPIFWIEPKLTRPTEEEQNDATKWAVRMFYLLLAFGALDGNTLQWYSGPGLLSISHNSSDVTNYLAGYPSALDPVKLTEEHMLIPMAEVNEATNIALARIGAMQNEERERFARMQRSAVVDAKNTLADDSAWKDLKHRAVELSHTISVAAIERKPISQYVDKAYALRDEIISHLSNIESLSMVLTVPVIRAIATSYTTSVHAKIVSLANSFESNVVQGKYQSSIDEVITHLFERGGFPQDTASETVLGRVIASHYNTAVERLRFALDNFVRHENGAQTYTSVEEKQMFDDLEGIS